MQYKKLLKKLKRLQRKFSRAKGSVERDRIMRSYVNTQAKMRRLGFDERLYGAAAGGGKSYAILPGDSDAV